MDRELRKGTTSPEPDSLTQPVNQHTHILLSNEVRLLLASCRARIEPGLSGTDCGLGDLSVDGPLLLKAAEAHQLEPLLHRFLANGIVARAGVDILVGLRSLVEWRVWAALHQATELRRITSALAASGIRPALLKGLALAETLYGDPGQRPGADLDLLVLPSEVPEAWQTLVQIGYRPRGLPDWVTIGSRVGRQLLRSKGEVTFCPDAGGVSVDLHWRLAHLNAAFPLSDEQRARYLQPGHIAGSEVLLLSPTLQAVYLAYHGTKHRWTKLCWLADIGMLVRHGSVDWEAAHELAQSLGVAGSLGQALCLAEKLLGVERPAALAGDSKLWGQSEHECRIIVPQVSRTLRRRTDEGGVLVVLEDLSLQLRQQRSWRGRLCILLGHLLPTTGDWALLRLPDRLAAGYYLLRPVRWVFRFGTLLKRALGLSAVSRSQT